MSILDDPAFPRESASQEHAAMVERLLVERMTPMARWNPSGCDIPAEPDYVTAARRAELLKALGVEKTVPTYRHLKAA